MKTGCQTVQLTVFWLLIASSVHIIASENTDQSETEINQAKTLTKRNADDLNMLGVDGKPLEATEQDLTKQLYELYGDALNNRMFETDDGVDFEHEGNYLPPYYLKDLGDNMDSELSTDHDSELEQQDENDGMFGSLAKRFSAPMGFRSRLGKRRMLDYVYNKRIPLGFVGALGKRAPMGFLGRLGKRAPMGFMGQLGKRAPMGFLGSLGKRAPLGFRGQLGKRAPMGFLGSLGKRTPAFSGPQRRAPMGFLGQIGKRGT